VQPVRPTYRAVSRSVGWQIAPEKRACSHKRGRLPRSRPDGRPTGTNSGAQASWTVNFRIARDAGGLQAYKTGRTCTGNLVVLLTSYFSVTR
jgi:hypothetical protein